MKFFRKMIDCTNTTRIVNLQQIIDVHDATKAEPGSLKEIQICMSDGQVFYFPVQLDDFFLSLDA